jgi:hypothetical protein
MADESLLRAQIGSERGPAAWRATVVRELGPTPFESLEHEVEGIRGAPAYFDASLSDRARALRLDDAREIGKHWSAIQDYSWVPRSASELALALKSAAQRDEQEIRLQLQRCAVLPSSGQRFDAARFWVKDEQIAEALRAFVAGTTRSKNLPVPRVTLDVGAAISRIDDRWQQDFAADLEIRFAFDPLRDWMRGDGASLASSDELRRILARNDVIWLIDARSLHDAGATTVQQVTFVLAALSWSADLWDDDAQASRWWSKTVIQLGVSGDIYLELAKHRAMRWLLTGLCDSLSFADGIPPVHAFTSTREWTCDGARTNLLRATHAAWAAALGGASQLTIAPFDVTRGHSSMDAERLASNMHLLLAQEAHLDRVYDPGHGAYAIESLTNEIIERAFQGAQDLAIRGGLMGSGCREVLWAQILEHASSVEKSVATGDKAILGANLYPSLLDDEGLEPLRVSPADSSESATHLEPRRWAAAFEALRRAFGDLRDGANARRFLVACVGDKKQLAPRMAWVRNTLSTVGLNFAQGFFDSSQGLAKRLDEEPELTDVLWVSTEVCAGDWCTAVVSRGRSLRSVPAASANPSVNNLDMIAWIDEIIAQSQGACATGGQP